MDELEISGKRYISTKRAAKEHKYNPDYIGQLIRAGKIDGKKIGRAWYVEAGAVSAYFDSEQISSNKESDETVSIHIQTETVTVENTTNSVNKIEDKIVEHTDSVDESSKEEHIIPIIVKSHTYEKEVLFTDPKPGRLKYLSDDTPLFPVAQRVETQTYATHVPLEERVKHIGAIDIQTRIIKKKRHQFFLLPLFLIGLVICGATLLIAAATITTLSESEGSATTATTLDFSYLTSFGSLVK